MKIKKSTPVKTVLTISMGFLVVYLGTHQKWALIVSFVIGLIGVFSTYLSKQVDFVWMKLTYILSLVVPNILLSLVFYFFLFPISLLSKLFGKKDPLILGNGVKSTYKETNKTFEKGSFEKAW